MAADLAALPVEIIRGECDVEQSVALEQVVSRIKALLVGPGMGRSKSVPKLLEKIYAKAKCPLVIDADALYFFKGGIGQPAVLTPHRGELCHLLDADSAISDLELLDQAERFAKQEKVVIVCKGAPTTIIFPNRNHLIVPYGNVGMASGGSGDVLAGIISALVAQGKSVEEAAILGTTIHALAGDSARDKKSIQSFSQLLIIY